MSRVTALLAVAYLSGCGGGDSITNPPERDVVKASISGPSTFIETPLSFPKVRISLSGSGTSQKAGSITEQELFKWTMSSVSDIGTSFTRDVDPGIHEVCLTATSPVETAVNDRVCKSVNAQGVAPIKARILLNGMSAPYSLSNFTLSVKNEVDEEFANFISGSVSLRTRLAFEYCNLLTVNDAGSVFKSSLYEACGDELQEERTSVLVPKMYTLLSGPFAGEEVVDLIAAHSKRPGDPSAGFFWHQTLNGTDWHFGNATWPKSAMAVPVALDPQGFELPPDAHALFAQAIERLSSHWRCEEHLGVACIRVASLAELNITSSAVPTFEMFSYPWRGIRVVCAALDYPLRANGGAQTDGSGNIISGLVTIPCESFSEVVSRGTLPHEIFHAFGFGHCDHRLWSNGLMCGPNTPTTYLTKTEVAMSHVYYLTSWMKNADNGLAAAYNADRVANGMEMLKVFKPIPSGQASFSLSPGGSRTFFFDERYVDPNRHQ